MSRVIELYSAARLLVRHKGVDLTLRGTEIFIEPAHDTLVLAWDKVHNWLDDTIHTLPLRRAIWTAALAWKKADRDEGLLWHEDPRLEHAHAASVARESWLNALEHEFVEASEVQRRQVEWRRRGISLAVRCCWGPMHAYENIAELMNDAAGTDGMVSVDEAADLVEHLRNEERPAEATAVERLFEMIDHFGEGDEMSVADLILAASVSFPGSAISGPMSAEEIDSLSPAELARRSPTTRAIVEVIEILALDDIQEPIPRDVPERGMEHIAHLIIAAAGADGVLSQTDQERLIKGLSGDGRGAEALATDYFLRFIDRRDTSPRSRITKTDVNRAVEFARAHLLRDKDPNHDGYSRAEIETFSPTAKSFLLVGQLMEEDII